MDYIPLKQCRHLYVYRVKARNFRFAVFDANQDGFVGIRSKWGQRYLFTEYHWDTGAPYGTVKPLEELEECTIWSLTEHKNPNLFFYLDGIKKRFPSEEEVLSPVCQPTNSTVAPVETNAKSSFKRSLGVSFLVAVISLWINVLRVVLGFSLREKIGLVRKPRDKAKTTT